MVTVKKQLLARPTAIRDARSVVDLLEPGLPPHVAGDLRLLVSEVVTNAIRHGGLPPDERIELTMDVRPSAVHVECMQPGASFAPEKRRPSARELAESGYGLHVVDSIAVSWGVKSDPTIVWFDVAI